MAAPKAAPGLIVTAPASGVGKTTLTLALLRALRGKGLKVAPAKVGPDYIDPGFHRIAAGRSGANLDAWAQRPARLQSLIANLSENSDLVLAEGVMGLFDGAAGGGGTTADVARASGWPLILLVDAARQAGSVSALVRGFRDHDPSLTLGGVVLNRVASPRHQEMLEGALASLGVVCFGSLPASADIARPSRHLGLVQADEDVEIEGFMAAAAAWVSQHLDLDRIVKAALESTCVGKDVPALAPLGQKIAVAHDRAFAFSYPELLSDWTRAGAELRFFSPLINESPDPTADAVYLPGGYPELHADQLAANSVFLEGLRKVAQRGACLYGECGGYMVLGEALVDGQGHGHAMAGLLPIETSFAEPKRHLGYRQASILSDGPLGPTGQILRGHEFHFASETKRAVGLPYLFALKDSMAKDLGLAGAVKGRVSGSFFHLIDRCDSSPD